MFQTNLKGAMGGTVGKVGKVGREGLIMPTWNQMLLPVNCGILAISWQDL